MQETKYDREITEVQRMLIEAENHFSIFSCLATGSDGDKVNIKINYTEVTRPYAAFFASTKQAHLHAMILCLYCLYETRPDTYSFSQLIYVLKKDNVLEPSVLNSLETSCKKLKDNQWKKCSRIRNEVFAHRSIKFEPHEVLDQVEVTFSDLENLIKGTRELVNDLTRNLRSSTHVFNSFASHSTKLLLEALDRDHQARMKQSEDELSSIGR